MRALNHLFENNRAWADRMKADDPEFFRNLSQQPSASCLWIGCSDGGQPPDFLPPGELVDHRNLAYLVVPTDLNCLSVLQLAVDVSKVQRIIVCGHYGCRGVRAALRGDRVGLVDNWLRHVQDVREKHAAQLATAGDESLRCDRLCELNVIEQVANVCQTTIVQDAWERGQELTVHGWIYAISDGLLRDLSLTIAGPAEFAPAYQAAVLAVFNHGVQAAAFDNRSDAGGVRP